MSEFESNYLNVSALQKNWPMKRIDVSFTLERGGALAILGPSGCGKSTILRMIAGLVQPDGGSVILSDIDITRIPAGKRKVGMVFQEHALFPHLTVEDNIAYGLVSRGSSKKAGRTEAQVWLDRFGLSGFGKRRVDSLSGGEKQRISLARTLAVHPALVLFDEPLSSLDTPLRVRLRTELRSRQQDNGYTAIYVTHDEEEASILADRILRIAPDS